MVCLRSINSLTMINIGGIVNSQLDYDALSFISAAGITNQTQVLAIHNLVNSLKIANVWSKMKAIYPFVGGTASTHKWNLKDPRDLNAAFRLVFYGGSVGWTHSSNGALPDGTSGYADTFFNPRNNLTNAELIHMSYYSRTNSAYSIEVVMGCSDSSGGTALLVRRSTDIGGIQHDVQTGNATYISGTGTVTNGSGFFLGVQTSTDIRFLRNNTSVTLTKTANRNVDRQNQSMFLGAKSQIGTADNFTNKQVAFASIGTTLTPQNETDLYNIVQQYQTLLGRQV